LGAAFGFRPSANKIDGDDPREAGRLLAGKPSPLEPPQQSEQGRVEEKCRGAGMDQVFSEDSFHIVYLKHRP
jgi:hypothetical protein